MHLVLASSSQRRRQLMDMCGYSYDVVVSNANEEIDEQNPHALVSALAEMKAREVFLRLISDGKKAEDIAVIGADTVVAFEGKIIGKPRSEQDAMRILRMLSGRTHTVYTGVSVVTEEGMQLDVSTTLVKLSQLSDEEINAYVSSGEPMDKAGAYGIQGPFGMFVDRIIGNYFTIIGLPLPELYRMLKNIGILPEFKSQ